jgi:hypothetical protein
VKLRAKLADHFSCLWVSRLDGEKSEKSGAITGFGIAPIKTFG